MNYSIREIFVEDAEAAKKAFQDIGATAPGSRIMADKLDFHTIKVKGLDTRAANILKQEMLSRGGDVVTKRDILNLDSKKTEVIIIGNKRSFLSLFDKLKLQPFGLKELAKQLNTFISQLDSDRTIIKTGKHALDISKTLIMGILNVTPDSFSDGGKYYDRKIAIERAEQMINQGADIIDVGGLSTRPGSDPVEHDEEERRVIPVIEEIIKQFDFPVSVDTYRSGIAGKAIDKGACIVNDISALRFDKLMAKTVAESKAGLILMHMQGTPENMQDDPYYDDVIEEVYDFLYERTGYAMSEGIEKDRIIVDPGIGFGKRLKHNLTIFRKLKDFRSLCFPLLIGASRKSFIGMISDEKVEDRLEGSIAAALWSVANSANIIRVHDVEETKKALKVFESIMHTG